MSALQERQLLPHFVERAKLADVACRSRGPWRWSALVGWAMDLFWQGTVVNGVRIYSAGDYRLGFLFMLGFALLAVAGAVRVRETHCRNLAVGG